VVAGAVIALGVGAVAGVAVAAGTSQDVPCTLTDSVLTCPLPPATPVTVTETSTETATVTQPPVTETVTQTVTPSTTTSSTTSSSSSTTPPASGFPDATNTGVPDGLTLTPYAGSGACNITTANVVLDARVFNCDVVIKAAGVQITRSKLNGRLVANTDNNPTASVTVSDSTIDGQQQETFPTVSYTNITLQRVEVVGGQHSVQCSKNCTVTDSWLHAQYLPRSSAGHVNAFISNGGSGFTLTHNTLDCSVDPTSGGGCTADASLFGDFGPIANATFDRNFFKANHAGYCLQAGYNPGKKYPNATGVKVTNNVFQRVGRDTTKCGLYGPVTAYNPSAAGNVWSGNVWDDGGTVNP
jgi:hypothetical protein